MPCSAGGYSTQLSFYSVKKENVNTFCKPWVTFLLFLFFFSMKTSCSDKKKKKKKLPVKRHSSQHFFCHFFFLNADCKMCVLLLSHWKKWVTGSTKIRTRTHTLVGGFSRWMNKIVGLKFEMSICVTQDFPLYLREESQKIHVHIFF